jgi:hypothetical protein
MSENQPSKPPGTDERAEIYGPLALTRHAKGDGRALILYARTRRAEGPVAERPASVRRGKASVHQQGAAVGEEEG